MQEKIKKLMNELNFNEVTATAYVETSGKCIYCNIDIINDYSLYSISQIDHIFPKSIYPELEWNINNNVLSCYYCNQIKRNFVPENLEYSAETILNDKKHRIKLIKKIKSDLKLNIKRTNELISSEKNILHAIKKILD